MKIKGVLKDVGGASRVTKRRLAAFEQASVVPQLVDPIGDVAREWHPGTLELVVSDIRSASPTAKTVRFERADGKKLPFFYAGQYISLAFNMEGRIVCRPYSISSAPFEARAEKPFVEITVRRSKGDGYISDYINDSLKVGDHLLGSMAMGQFYWESLRDAKNIVALAGGVGITPFASMAKEIAHGTLDVDLTILYGSVSSDDIILKDELAALEGEHVHVVNVLSGDEPEWKGERGYITAELIKKYSKGDCSYFVCGPQAMYRFLRGEVAKLGVPAKRLRFEVFGQPKDVTAFEGYPKELADKTFRLTVVRGIQKDVIDAKACESLVTACEKAGIILLTDCRSGECGFCRTKVLAGDYFVSPEGDGRRAADKDFNYVHACSTYPLSDMTIKIPIV
ncbi:MAG: 2Fe-2S iron-sulfur cluster binding domain-containing protein [Firmicutes bacterium]|nr:2Fe-2S iron-sulfur cluster binding domain-containing protein [Bacillota bacterium]